MLNPATLPNFLRLSISLGKSSLHLVVRSYICLQGVNHVNLPVSRCMTQVDDSKIKIAVFKFAKRDFLFGNHQVVCTNFD